MPEKFMKPCAYVGCRTLVYNGYCKIHKPASHTTRNEYYYLYNNSRWKKYRVIYLAENPFCKVCGQRANVVDHIKDHKGDFKLFWDTKNHQPLCKKCHDVKTGKENARRKTTSPRVSKLFIPRPETVSDPTRRIFSQNEME